MEIVLSRPPTADELSELTAYYEAEHDLFESDPTAVQQLLRVGESPRKKGLDPIAHAATTSTARVILNLNEAMTRQ